MASVQQAEENQRNIDALSKQQEKALVANVKLLPIPFLLLNYYVYQEVPERYTINAHKGIQLLIRLDHLGVIDLR